MATKKKSSLWRTREELAQDRSAKREAILRVAIDLFGERGFAGTSLDDVADRLGVTKPTIYHYFKTKEDILFQGVQVGMTALQESLESDSPGATGLERLRHYLQEYALVAVGPYGRCVNRAADHELSDSNREEFRSLRRSIDHGIREIVKSGIEDKSIRPMDPRLASFAVTGALNSMSKWFDPEGPRDPREVALEMVDIMLIGFAPR
jgi:AcrR family transcriptional regulator